MTSRYRKIINKYIRETGNVPLILTPQARQQALDRIANPGPLTFQLAETEVCRKNHEGDNNRSGGGGNE
jgi:hypothetical protein